ncbi:TetR/AcrR family transcriptional regulator [Streptomyces sp. NPDC002078]
MREDELVKERTQPQRRAYHHGDLRNALSTAGVELAREGGPEAVVLREAARRAGVSPTAAYRHFASHADLLVEVKHRAQAALADAMEAALASTAGDAPRDAGRGEQAARRLRAIGWSYVDFARDQPGLFRTAFCRPELTSRGAPAQARGRTEALDHFDAFRSFHLLRDALDELLAAGLITPARRPGAEAAAWAAVHGLATLMLDGPLRGLSDPARGQVVEQTLAMVADGLRAP